MVGSNGSAARGAECAAITGGFSAPSIDISRVMSVGDCRTLTTSTPQIGNAAIVTGTGGGGGTLEVPPVNYGGQTPAVRADVVQPAAPATRPIGDLALANPPQQKGDATAGNPQQVGDGKSAWSTPNVKADLPAETIKRDSLKGDDKPVIHVLKGNDTSNWPENQTPDVVIKADGVHVRPDFDQTGKTLKDIYVKIESDANEATVKQFFNEDLNRLTSKKATIDAPTPSAVPADVKKEYDTHENAPPPTPSGGACAGGDGKPGPTPAPPPELSPEEKRRIEEAEKRDREREQETVEDTGKATYQDVLGRFDKLGGLSDARSVALSWLPPNLMGEYAALMSGMSNPPTPEELKRLQEWLGKHRSDIEKHMNKNAAAMEALGDTEGAEAMRSFKNDLGSDEFWAKQGQENSFFGQSADALNGRPVSSPDLGLGAEKRKALGHSHVIDEVEKTYRSQPNADPEASISKIFNELKTDEKDKQQLAETVRSISPKANEEDNSRPRPNPPNNGENPGGGNGIPQDLSRLLNPPLLG